MIATPSAMAPAHLSMRTGTERGMRFLLGCVIATLVVSDVFDMPMSMGMGLSAKNALLYLLAVALFIKIVVQQSFVFELKTLQWCFAILIAYALLSVMAVAFFIEYPHYRPLGAAISWKSRLADQAIFFLVFFYGLRDSRNAYSTAKLMLIAVAIGSLVAALNAWGVARIGELGENENGRVVALMGEPNQDAAFLSLFIPCIVAALFASRGLWRAAWFVGLLLAVGAMLMTASRGGFVASLLAAGWGAFVFRRYIPPRRIAMFAAWGAVLLTIVVMVMSIRYGDLLYSRVIGDSTQTDIVGISSGRLQIWSIALGVMAEEPITFLTGYGWDMYDAMPFRLAPHNHYLALWFNLGAVGLICGTLILVLVGRQAHTAVAHAPLQFRPMLMAFTIGTLGISIATFFVDLFAAWYWFWAFAGLVMRIAVNTLSEPQPVAARAEPVRVEPQYRRDPFGWVVSPRH